MYCLYSGSERPVVRVPSHSHCAAAHGWLCEGGAVCIMLMHHALGDEAMGELPIPAQCRCLARVRMRAFRSFSAYYDRRTHSCG